MRQRTRRTGCTRTHHRIKRSLLSFRGLCTNPSAAEFDTAKLANCGLDPRSIATETQMQFVKAWGGWMRQQLADIATGPKNATDGFFSASCLQHGGNFGFTSSPVVNGVHMRDAISNWFFEHGRQGLRFTVDDCGDLPCTSTSGPLQNCPHITPPSPPTPISDLCKAELNADCPGKKGAGQACRACVREHANDLKQHGCPEQAAPVFEYFCGAPPLSGTIEGIAEAHARQRRDAVAGNTVLNAVGSAEEYDAVRIGSGTSGHHVCDLLAAVLELASRPALWTATGST